MGSALTEDDSEGRRSIVLVRISVFVRADNDTDVQATFVYRPTPEEYSHVSSRNRLYSVTFLCAYTSFGTLSILGRETSHPRFMK